MSLKREIKFEIAKRSKYAFLRKLVLPENAVVVHQMGKVGSMAIVQAIEGSRLKAPVIHSHALSRLACKTLAGIFVSDSESFRSIRKELFLSAVNRERIEKTARRKKQVNVITISRDPVSQIVSSFFQVFERDFQRWLGFDTLADKTRIVSSCLSFLTKEFESYYYGESPKEMPERVMRYFIARPQSFYEQDFYDTWDFSVSQNVSEVPQGGFVVKSPNARILLLRFEDLPEYGDASLARFLSVTNLKMVSRNATSGKGDDLPFIYKSVKEKLRLKPGILELLYENPVMRSFYSHEERNKLKDFWCRLPS